jgi:hypothetical protein
VSVIPADSAASPVFATPESSAGADTSEFLSDADFSAHPEDITSIARSNPIKIILFNLLLRFSFMLLSSMDRE